MKAFGFHQPRSRESAIGMLGENNYPLAGGTDLITLLNADIRQAENVVDIKHAKLPEGISQSDDGVSIGAMTTIADVVRNDNLRQHYTLLTEAARLTATHQLRNRATVGGNLLQETRCWYYRHKDIDCWLKGGEHCPAVDGRNDLHAVIGGGPCVAVHPSDLAGCLMALDASVKLVSPAGERQVALRDFLTLPGPGHRRLNSRAADELLLSIEIPGLPADTRTTYLKAMNRKAWAFALVGVAMVITLRKGRIAGARAVLNGVAPVPWPLQSAAAAERPVTAGELGTELIAGFDKAASALTHNGYKIPLARVLLRDAIEKLMA